MKYATVIFSLLMAVVLAASLNNAGPGVVARDKIEGEVSEYSEHHHRTNGTEHEDMDGLEKRKKRKWGSPGTSHHHNKQHNTTSDATSLMKVNMGVLVAGMAGAGVGAIFL
ncbi:hypothetical protein N657DRAFT_649995 [Parathielavia appendiculata]|uniref:Uncharacterized protein n=1 Tax=Parathielavia appendiculata TaxID=2587402 RepID=A0AAN6Z0P0_9PEZI|nr:hypothetical protein N657DRAFT_649995 [Parathielavia appendiculata]